MPLDIIRIIQGYRDEMNQKERYERCFKYIHDISRLEWCGFDMILVRWKPSVQLNTFYIRLFMCNDCQEPMRFCSC